MPDFFNILCLDESLTLFIFWPHHNSDLLEDATQQLSEPKKFCFKREISVVGMYLYLYIFWICTNRIFNGDINLLVKCSVSVATLRHTILCTYEIPVWVNGYDLYVDAYTKIINEKHVTNVLSDIRTNQCNEKKKIKYYCCLIHIKEDI